MKAIEKQFFEWKDWDDIGPMDLSFYNVTLKRDIGAHKKGAKFLAAILLLSESKLMLETEGGESYEYNLKLEIY